MDDEQGHASSPRAARLAEKMRDKEYRDAYVEAHTRRFLALQIRRLRGERSQADFAAFLGKKQTVVSRLEDPAYAGWSLRTVFEVARKLNVAAVVRFVDFQTFLNFTGDQSETAAKPLPYDQATVEERDSGVKEQPDDSHATSVGATSDQAATWMPPNASPTSDFPASYSQPHAKSMMGLGAVHFCNQMAQRPSLSRASPYGSLVGDGQQWESYVVRGLQLPMTQLPAVNTEQRVDLAKLKAEVENLVDLKERQSAELFDRANTDKPMRESNGMSPVYSVAVGSKQLVGAPS